MNNSLAKFGVFAATLLTPLLVAACQNPGSVSCDAMAENAKETSQSQQYKINAITNLRETSRTQNEARCQGTAAWSDNSSSDIYLRSYAENGNSMIAYSNQPFP